MHRARLAALLATVLLAGSAAAAPLYGVSFDDGMLYDVDPATGAASNARQIRAYPCDHFCGDVSNPVTLVTGLDVHPAQPDRFVLATHETSPDYASTLMSGELADPFVAFDAVELLGVQIGEGGIALEPFGNDVFLVGLSDLSAPFLLVRVDPLSGPFVAGEIGFSDISALAFDAAGTLYALDTGSDQLLVLDPDDAGTLSSVALSAPLGQLAGMDFDTETGTLYVADGGMGGRDALMTLDPATGVLSEIGLLGLENGLSGLAVPEPAALPLAAVAAAVLAAETRRRVGRGA